MSKDNIPIKLPLDKIEIGQFIRWKADRLAKCWDCPGIITGVDFGNKTFKVRTFDTFIETENITFYVHEEASEFSLIDKSIAIQYIKNSILTKKQDINDLECLIENIKSEIAKADTYLKEILGE